MNESRDRPRSFGLIGLILGLWLVVALGLSAAGLLARAPVPPPAIAFLLSGLAIVLLGRSSTIRDQARSLGAGPLIAFHIIRLIVGAYFLFLYRRAALPGEFAVPAGWGDIFVGIGAILVLWLCVPVYTRARRNGLLLWNVVGLIDILMVLGNGMRLFVRDPEFGASFTRFPLALLPTFIVPLVITSHLLIFWWYRKVEARSTQPHA